MPFIDSAEAQYLKDKFTEDLSYLGRLYKSKNSKYHTRNVDHNLVEPFIEDGWEEYGKPLKTKTKLRKPKVHSIQFEDDLWCQLYKLGYRCLNISSDFRLPFGKGSNEKKQIDVIAVDEDSILLVECKSSKKPAKPPSFKTEFEALKLRLHGYSKSLDQLFGKGRKVKYIFATRNLRINIDSTDVHRLLQTGSFYYNDNTFDYINRLIQSYRDAAHYQFLALLFKGQKINNEKIEVPALEGKMGTETYYMFSLEPHSLLKMGFVLHRTRANESEMPTYQRLLVPSRLKKISKFIENGGYFPNSIILNFSEDSDKVEFQPHPRSKDSRSRSGMLKIPNAYAIAYIIDGQHRVYGYAYSDYKESNTIPVVAFLGLEPSEQLELFMDINQNQKAVSPTLRITLEEDLYWKSDRTDSRMKALRSSVIRRLGGDQSSPLFGKISLGEDRAELTAKPFADSLLRCGLLPTAMGNKYNQETTKSCLYDTGNLDHAKEMILASKRIVSFINLCYEFSEHFCEGKGEVLSTYIFANRGTYAFISLLGSLNSYETDLGNVSVKTSAEDRFSAIRKYLETLLEALQKIPKEQEARLLGKLGSGAQNTWFRSFQSFINKRFRDYEPSELLDWKERQDKEVQDKGRSLGTNIERHIKKTIIGNLKVLFGENWDIEIGAIQRDCEHRAREQMEKNYKEGLGRHEILWTEQFFIRDYKTIIEKYWIRSPEDSKADFITFEEHFSIDVGQGTHSKAEKLKWLSIFSSYRNLWAHEGTKEKGLNLKEVDFLQSVHDHFDL